MPRIIDTIEAARLLRAALKTHWPTTRFSVRRGQGTSSNWLSIAWIDGPTQPDVQALADRTVGRSYDGHLGPVRLIVDGITTHRQIGPNGITAVANEVLRIRPDARPLNGTGQHLTHYELDAEATEYLTHGFYTTPATVWQVAHIIHARTDLSTTTERTPT